MSIVTGHFGYKGCEQHVWRARHAFCAGNRQSPIAISSFKAIPTPLPALEMIGYHDFLLEPLILTNNGHSVTVRSNNSSGRNGTPYIFGAGFRGNEEYDLDHLHFHWGRKNNRGSEHTLNGVRYPMEMHLVHKNKAYESLSEALNFENGLAVLGIFFQLQEGDNEELQSVVNELLDVQDFGKETRLNNTFMLSSLMPRNTALFYTYKGSLTTPPCNEVVTWVIFPNPVPISFRQMNVFRKLSSSDGRLVDNYRKLQEIGDRQVYARKWELSIN